MVEWRSFGGAVPLILAAACTTAAPFSEYGGRPSQHHAPVDASIDAFVDASVDASVDARDEGSAPLPPNSIVLENALPGTREWKIAQPSPAHEIEAYADTTSAVPGEIVRIFASASARTTFRWKLF